MKHAARDFLIGLTALLGLVGIIATLILFGEIALSRPAGYPITLRLNQADGLTPGGPVTMNGVTVGQLTELRTAADPRDGVELTLRINQGIRIPRDISVTIARDLVGDARLSLTARRTAPTTPPGADPPVPDPADEFVQPGETIVADATGLIEQISGLLDERLTAVERAADSFTELAGTYKRVGERLEHYLEPRSVSEVDAGASPSLGATLQRLDQTLTDAQSLLAEDGVRADLASTIERTNIAISSISETAEEWSETARSTRASAASLEQSIAQATTQITSVATRLDAATADLQRILASINSGNGTVAQLLNNPDLYNAFVDASRRIERAVFEAQLLLEKYRKEGIPIQF
ncbi:MAG: MlaD family protein [Phycisphaerales bacterium]